MRKRIVCSILILAVMLSLCGCLKTNSDSTFSIQFIDVGQGDSALIECDGHYMLIDGGDLTAGDKIYNVLEERGIQKLDILAISHLHSDHIGGLIKALSYASSIGKTISNSADGNTDTFRKLEHQLGINGTSISVPHTGDKFELGSATVEVIDCANEEENDSLVLLITYGKTSFLFTGDIEETAQTRISDRFENSSDKSADITLIKMPHHGSYTGTLYRFIRTFMPEYAVISVGSGNPYGHPHRETMDLLNSKTYSPKVYRTDLNGDIIVRSDGKTVSIETSR